MSNRFVPEYRGLLRHHFIEVPTVIHECSGIRIFGRRIKSLVFSTDVAIIKNINADAVISVYPFTPQPAITHAVLLASDMPVFAGVGGGVTRGLRVVNLAMDAEFQGATAVVVNAPTENEIITRLKKTIDIPVVVTVVSEETNIRARLDAGADMINVSGADRTPAIVRAIRESFPEVPIIATGGATDETIRQTIAAGANAITYTPPSNGELFRLSMDKYRAEQAGV
ncbi:MAG: hydrolase [Oscillospiraceae bacterium]|jgi:DNA-binding NarL/FixJ family response regulator|nr:hydrolase [Oscillospiraceae bacterium]